ncbi:uncharacterized protein I303_101731 [Kwoniella dejecticola CBS 10117]|uniref:Uncharacterized protein n=1 Tax=Kwoniella dejecticola CBS 10117 TaxID=1296121 RepID=A0A1A6ACZ5_9TREE|nr:uncharacterized protein I303_02133 [Kwoniella dejecticola CBS 10117]OBR87918.1 hypothetical protein I303_02133 [Kwoniella dejecticola CBS 10117]
MSSPSSTNLPFGLSNLFRPINPLLAKTRIKSNLFILFLFSGIKRFLPPYVNIRLIIVRLSDTYLQGRKLRESSWAEGLFYYIEFMITSILIWNILESVISIQYPPATQSGALITQGGASGLVLTPSKISSPLTRSYSPSSSSSNTPSTPNSNSNSNPNSSLQRTIYKSSPLSTPIRNPNPNQNQNQSQSQNQVTNTSNLNISQSGSPHSTSKTTARLFNLPPNENASPSKTGLFFEKKQETPQSQSQSQQGQPGVGGDFVLVDREEKLWVDNVLKGVRGKGGKVNVGL